MKNFFARLSNWAAVLMIAAICFASLSVPVGAVTLSEPYFDLEFDKTGKAFDAKGNIEVALFGGSVQVCDVVENGTAYKATGYRAQIPGEYIDLALDTAKFASPDDLRDFIFSGLTLELYLQLDYPLTATAGLFGSCNGGGFMLYGRTGNCVAIQIGSDGAEGAPHHSSNNKYSYSGNTKDPNSAFETGKLAHLLGIYDPATNELKVYVNGVLTQSSSYGTSPFLIGQAYYEYIGIGLNPSYPSEEIAKQTPYTVLDAKIYNHAFTDEQAMLAYEEQKFNVTSGAALIEVETTTAQLETTPAPETTTAPVTSKTETSEAPSADTTVAPGNETTTAPAKDKKDGCGSSMAIGTMLVFLPAAYIIIRKSTKQTP